MDEKLNIRNSLPMSGLSIKVKSMYKHKQDVWNRNFDRHLKRDMNKQKKKNVRALNSNDLGATIKSGVSNVDSGINEKIRQEGKYTQLIDVLA